jgi:hypothetical protein
MPERAVGEISLVPLFMPDAHWLYGCFTRGSLDGSKEPNPALLGSIPVTADILVGCIQMNGS